MASDSDPQRPTRVFRSFKERYEADREFDAKAPWRDWVRQRYAKQWYAFGCALLDVMVVGTILQVAGPSQLWPYGLSIMIVVGLTYLELKGLQRFWPRKPPV